MVNYKRNLNKRNLKYIGKLKGVLMEITREMQEHFTNRTKRHIELTQKYANKIGLDASDHDASKLKDPEMTPYIWISWNYKMKRDGIDFEMPADMQEKANEATYRHITHNRHHPEYWDNDMFDGKLNSKDRDGIPEVMVDATSMPIDALKEMCCDWSAMGEELGNSPHDWADKVVNVRYKFTPHQCFIIYGTLDEIWNS